MRTLRASLTETGINWSLGAAEAIGDLLQCGGLVVRPLDALVQ